MFPGHDEPIQDNGGSCPAAWEQTHRYATTFEETKALVLKAICDWYPQRASRELDLSGFEACVAVKNYDWNIVFENASFRRLFTGGIPGMGRGADAFVYRKSNSISASTDQLIRDGATMIEFEHINGDHLGRLCTVRTYKCRLDELSDPNFYILGISRPLALIGTTEKEQEKSLNELFGIFQKLDDTDQTICRLDAKGDTTKDIAASVGLTSRSIEIRRKKMMDLFDVHRPMELIRITIRLEEHGLLS